MIKKLRIAMFKFLDIMMILTMVLGSPMSVSASALAQDPVPALTLDKAAYAPGESAHITGSGFTAGDYVLIANGLEWGTVTADESGGFTSDSPALEAGTYEVGVYPAGGDTSADPVAAISFTVTAVPPPTAAPTEAPTATEPPTAAPTDVPTDPATIEPTVVPTDTPTSEPTVAPTDTPTLEPVPLLPPFIESDKADYNPGELVTLHGGNWQGDTQVRIFVNDNLGQIWSRDVIVDVASDGTVVDSFNLPTLFVASYIVSASGQQTGRVVTTTFTDAAALTLTKSASPLTYTAAGVVVNYSYLLQNTGTTTLNGPFTVTDNKVPSVSCPATSTLAPGASITCTGTYTTSAADVTFGYVANTATASSSGSGATASNPDVRIVSIPVDCRVDSDGANDEPGQKDLTKICNSPTAVNPELISWNWDVVSMSGSNSADGCALFDTDNDGLANYSLCVSWQNNRVMQAGYPQLYSCNDSRSDRCAGSVPLTISNGSACAVELASDDPFPAGDSYPQDAKAFCSINLADVGGAAKSSLIDVCSYPSVQPNSDPSDCVLISTAKGNLEVIKNVDPDNASTNWNMSWTGPTPYSTAITGDGNTGIQAVNAGSYTITESAGTGTDMSLYDSTWACTVDGSPSTSGSGTTINGVSVAKGSVVICTFTNTRKTGSLEIKKDVVPDNASTNWNFAITGPDPTFTNCSIVGDGTCGAKTVFSGSYSITETAGSGTSLSDYGTTYACTVNGGAGPSGTGTTISGLTISKSDVVVCTFTNSQSPGTITVNKVVVPATDTGKFNLLIDGTAKASNVGDGGTTGAVSVSAGSHTVSESAGTGTDLNNYVTTITGDCDSSGNVSVSPNQNKTCTITNTRKGTIIVEKQTDPDGAAGNFTFTGDAAGTIADNGQIVVSNLAPGTYTSTESSLAADFSLESISCDDSSSATPSTVDLAAKKATFKLDPGETVKCTFTNKKLNPDLVVTKTADAASVTAGDPIGFSISVKNNGLGTAYNVTLSDTLPAISGVTWAIASQPSGDPCTLTGNSLSCAFGNLASSASTGAVHITGTTTALSCGTWNNTATAQADNNAPATGSASIFVDCATIKISKTAGSSTVSAGDPISYTITVTNDNSGTAHNVKVTDTLPTNAGLGAWTLSGTDAGACSTTAGILTCNFGDVAGHASKTVTLTATTTAATCGTVSNTASVTTSNDGSDSSTATVTVQCPSLSVTKTPDAATVNAGDPVGFTITVHNAGPGVAKSITLTDSLPAGLTWTSTPGSPTCTISSGTLTCGLGDLASGADATVHITATSSPSTCGPLTNTATATPTNGTAATSAPATITVNCADITVTKTGNGPISAGDTATFTITVQVTGSGSLSNVTLSDPLPAGVTWALDAPVTGCSISGSSPQTISCSWATLAAPQTITISVSGTTSAANCAAPLSNTATVAAANETDTTNDTASASITVQCATIQIEKTTSTPTVSAGDPISYTITVTNPGPGIARNVTITDTLPTTAGLDWSYPASCSLSGGVLTCNLGDIAGGGSKSVTLTSPTTAASCGTINNTASVTTTNDGSGQSSASVTVNCPSLSVTKTADAASVNAGDTVGFTITVSNAGPGEAKGVTISDSLPGGLAWSVDAGNTTATDCSITGGTLTCGPDTIASDGSVQVHVTATSTPAVCGALSNTATATPTNGDAATSQTSTITVLCPDLTVTKTGNGPISAGDTATFTIEVKNIGAGVAKSVTLTDTLPGGLTWALDPANAACSITGTTTQTLSCSWATLASNASVSVTISATTTKDNCGTLTNSASVAATNEANTSNNSSGDTNLEVDCATIQIEKTTSTPTVSAGDTVSYTITVSNPGLGTAKDVVVTDSLPGGLTWTINPTVSGCSISGGTLTCNFGSILSGGSKSVTVTATTAKANCGTLTNTASVTTSNDGAATTPATVITVQCPNLSVTKTPDAASVSAGDTIGFTITVSNAGPGEAKGVTISDSLPAGLAWTVDAGNTTATGCSITAGTLTCGPDTIASGSSVKVHVTAVSTAASCGTLSNSATATPTNGDAATSQTSTITVLCPDLTVTKTGNGPISAGDTATFTIEVKNTGLGEAKNVTLTDTLPSGVTWALTPAVTGCSITGTTTQTLSCSWATLASGADIAIVVSGTTASASCGKLDNLVTVSAGNETSTSNNTADASITVNCATIQIVKSTTTATVSAGTPINFTITVTNSGAGIARNVTVTDNLPTTAGLNWTIDPAVNGCSITGTTLTCNFGDIAAGGSKSATLTSPTTAASCGTISNTASVSTTNDGSGQSSASVTINCPDLTVEKTGNGTINSNDTAIYTITVTNNGAGDATGVTLSDTLPAHIIWSVDNAACSVNTNIDPNVLNCNFGTLAAGTSITIHVSGTTSAVTCGTLNNTVSVAATNEADNSNNSATGTVTVNCASISITKTASSPISAGDTLAYTITVSNTGSGTAYGVTVTDTLPTTAGLGPWTVTPGDPTCKITSGVLSCSLGDMPTNTSQTITLSSPTTYASCGTIFNEAGVNTTNDGMGKAGTNVVVQCPALTVTKTADAGTVSAGDQIGFTITVTNTGDGIARNVSLSDTLPTGTGISWTIASSDPTCTLTGSALSCTFGDLAKGVSKSVHVTSPTTKDSCASYDNTATASADNQPSVTSSQASITVQCASITITKKADTTPVNAGDPLGFTITVTNPGPGNAYGVTVTDTLAINPGLAWEVSPAVSGCSITGGVLTCNFGTLAPNTTKSVHISSPTTAATCGQVPNTAYVTTTNDGEGHAGDVISVFCPDVTVTKTAASGTVSAGDPISFTITVKNEGAGTAKGVTLNDTLPTASGLNWSVGGTDAADCSIASGVVTCDFGDLAPSVVKSITLTSPTTPASCATISNTATVSATNEPTGQTNNSSTASIDVLCANISILKRARPDSGVANAGDPIFFQIDVVNEGAGTAKNVVISDTLPSTPGLYWMLSSLSKPDSSTGSCSVSTGSPQVLTCTFDQLVAHQSIGVSVSSATTLATACATINNTASVTTSNDGAKESSAAITITCPNIGILKRVRPDSGVANAGDTIQFQIDVFNTGLSAASNVVITDTLPNNPGLHWVLSSLSKPNSSTGSCSVSTSSPQVLTCTFDQLAAGQSIGVSVASVTTYATCSTLSNTASYSTGNDGSGTTTPATTITINCPALEVTKTPDTQTVSAGEPIMFTINVANTGAGTAKNVTLSDPLPADVTWSVDNDDCEVDANGLLTCSFGDLAPGASTSVTVTGDAVPAMCGTFDNTATVKMDNGPDVESNTVSVTVKCPDVTVTKEAVTGTINAGDTAAFKIVVSNTGAGTAYAVTLTDSLPAGVTWTIDPAVAECDITGGVLSCSWPSLAAGASVTINVSGATSAALCGKLDNTVTVAANNEAANQTNNQASASITVNCSDVAVTKEAVTGAINAGDTAAFKIVVSNTGTGTAYNVIVTDTLPAGITWSIDPAVTGCTITGNTLSCSFATLAAGASVEINVRGATSAALCGKLDNTVTVAASNESNTDNNSADASITVNCPDVSVTKQAVSGTINAGDTAAFKIVISNGGAGTAYNVTLHDTLPAGITWTIDPAVTGCSITGNTLSCSFATLAAGATVEITVTGTTSPALCGKLDNTATVAATNEANTDNNSASATITVNCSDITVTKEAVAGTINAGDTAAFKVVVTNSGAGTAYNVTLNDTLPAGITWTIDPAVTGCSITGNTLSCSWATLAAGASVEINVSGTAPAAVCGKLDNTVTVAASNEANTDNNSASASITVNCAQIGLTKVHDAEFANAGDTIGFTITVTNSGAGTAYDVEVTDSLPTNAGMNWTINPAVTGCSITGGVLTCSFATLASGASISIHITSPTTPDSCGRLDNTARVTTSNDGTASAQSSIFVNCPDVEVFKFADNSPINAGDVAKFTIVVSNAEIGTAYGVTLTDNLPAGVTWSEDSPYCSITGGVLSCDFGNLVGGGYRTVHVTGTTDALACGVLTNTATVAASNEPDDYQTDNSSTATIAVNCPDVKVTKTASNASIHLGQDAIYDIVVENIGAGKAYNVTLNDTLPGTLTWSLVQPVPGCTLTGNNLSCAWASLDSSAKITIQLKATITTRDQCASLTNTVTVAATNEKEADTANNTSTANITVTCPVDLTVSKTANPAFKRTFAWSISKSVDKTRVEQINGSTATFNYAVTVTETGFTDSDWVVTGKITVTNLNDWIDIPLTGLTDAVGNGGTCTVKNFTAGTSVPKSGSLTYDYTCTYSSKPDPYAGVNTATATWDASIGTPHGSASNTANFAFDTNATGNPTNINKTVTVTDTFNGTTTTLGTVTATTTLPYTTKIFTYTRTIPVTWYPCKNYTNTAKIVETGQTASATVTVCGPINSGAKTIGFWQNKNGQDIIKKAGAVNGVCKLTPWLRQFAPFQDLSATASCNNVASYVTNVIKAANASGASMNAMLKAQMLATALDVYFSNPALGGNKIGAPAPIGGLTIDLTYIYAGGKYINVSAAFGGATSMKVMDMLIYAASKSNVGGSIWYSNVKSTQELAKDAFDAINNSWAFPP